MIIILTTDDGPQLADADRFDRLHVESAVPIGEVQLGTLVTPGEDEGHVWLDLAELAVQVEAAAAADDAPAKLAAMVDLARTRGWVSEDGLRVRAHLADA